MTAIKLNFETREGVCSVIVMNEGRHGALAACHSEHRARLQNRRSRVRIPPGLLGLYTLKRCCQNLICIAFVFIIEKNKCCQKNCLWRIKQQGYSAPYSA
jgi:hypothetical protein